MYVHVRACKWRVRSIYSHFTSNLTSPHTSHPLIPHIPSYLTSPHTLYTMARTKASVLRENPMCTQAEMNRRRRETKMRNRDGWFSARGSRCGSVVRCKICLCDINVKDNCVVFYCDDETNTAYTQCLSCAMESDQCSACGVTTVRDYPIKHVDEDGFLVCYDHLHTYTSAEHAIAKKADNIRKEKAAAKRALGVAAYDDSTCGSEDEDATTTVQTPTEQPTRPYTTNAPQRPQQAVFSPPDSRSRSRSLDYGQTNTPSRSPSPLRQSSWNTLLPSPSPSPSPSLLGHTDPEDLEGENYCTGCNVPPPSVPLVSLPSSAPLSTNGRRRRQLERLKQTQSSPPPPYVLNFDTDPEDLEDENYCTGCNVPMGAGNGRQLCRKTWCPIAWGVEALSSGHSTRQSSIEASAIPSSGRLVRCNAALVEPVKEPVASSINKQKRTHHSRAAKRFHPYKGRKSMRNRRCRAGK